MIQMYRIDNLSSTAIGQYSLYGHIEKLTFTSDSAYVVMSIADTRLFFMMLCDVEVKGHLDRVLVSYDWRATSIALKFEVKYM